MKLYIDKENLLSIISKKEDERFSSCVDLFSKHLSVKYNFDLDYYKKPIDELDNPTEQDLDEHLVISKWLRFVADRGFEAENPSGIFVGGELIPNRNNLSNYHQFFKLKDYSSIYLLTEGVTPAQVDDIARRKEILIGNVGEELDVLSGLIIKDDEKFAKDMNWNVDVPDLPFSEILLCDPYFLENEIGTKEHRIEVLDVLLRNHGCKASVNIVVFSRGFSILGKNTYTFKREEIENVIKQLSKIYNNTKITIVTQNPQFDKEKLMHDRCLITNYIRIKHGQGFNVSKLRNNVIVDLKSRVKKTSNAITQKIIDQCNDILSSKNTATRSIYGTGIASIVNIPKVKDL